MTTPTPDPAAPVGPRQDTVEDLTKDELYEIASQHDLPGRSKMSREELIDAIREAGVAPSPPIAVNATSAAPAEGQAGTPGVTPE